MLAGRRLMLTAMGIWLYWALICAIGWTAEPRLPPLNPVRPQQVRELLVDAESFTTETAAAYLPTESREELPPSEPEKTPATANPQGPAKGEKNKPNQKPQATPPLPKEQPLNAITTDIKASKGKVPANAAEKWAAQEAALPGGSDLFAQVNLAYYWDAPNLCYRPLYFEEPNLERLGYSRCPLVQPATSGIHFLASTLALPYQMTLHRPREQMYPLGHYRPGNPAPYRRILPEWDAKAAVVQGAVVTGLIFVIP